MSFSRSSSCKVPARARVMSSRACRSWTCCSGLGVPSRSVAADSSMPRYYAGLPIPSAGLYTTLMDTDVRALIAQLHDAPVRYALALTGGGAAAAGWLLSVPGGSRTVLEVAVPYDEV